MVLCKMHKFPDVYITCTIIVLLLVDTVPEDVIYHPLYALVCCAAVLLRNLFCAEVVTLLC